MAIPILKSFIIAAVSADGFIARNPESQQASAASQISTAWTSKADKQRFVELTKRAKVVIMGSTTYRTIGRPLKDRLNIVYSHNTTNSEIFAGVEVTSEEPAKILESLASRGYTEVAICGGSQIYTKFMEAGLVDRIYLTIEPILFGNGVPLFSKALEYKLELVTSSVAESGTIMVEYKVKY